MSGTSMYVVNWNYKKDLTDEEANFVRHFDESESDKSYFIDDDRLVDAQENLTKLEPFIKYLKALLDKEEGSMSIALGD